MFRSSFEIDMSPAQALAALGVAAYDPDSKGIAPPRWEKDRPLHAELQALMESVGVDAGEVAGPDAARRRFDELVDCFEAMTHASGPRREAAVALGQRIRDEARILFWAADLGRAPEPSGRTAGDGGHSLIVIPFRCQNPEDGRLRNLGRVLSSLGRQSVKGFDVVVVEDNASPEQEAFVRQRGARYLHLENRGRFNKAAAINAATSRASDCDRICVLDCDVWIDDGFVEICVEEMMRRSAAALVTYKDMFFLDRDSTARAAAVTPGESVIDGRLTGYLTPRSPGGCVWVTAAAFRQVGGFDGKFSGWGGEDRDFIDRLDSAFGVHRLPGVMLHLDHERAPEIQAFMRGDHPWRQGLVSDEPPAVARGAGR